MCTIHCSLSLSRSLSLSLSLSLSVSPLSFSYLHKMFSSNSLHIYASFLQALNCMALRSSLCIFQRAVSPAVPGSKTIEILSFEVATLISRLLQILHHDLSSLTGGATVFSGDVDFLLSVARAELTNSLRRIGESISFLAEKCSNPSLLQFKQNFSRFADSGVDHYHWVMNRREIEATLHKLDRYLSATSVLYDKMEKLRESEQTLKKLIEQDDLAKTTTIYSLKKALNLKKQEIDRFKRTSLWSFSFDRATLLLARLSFTALFNLRETIISEEDNTLALSQKYPSFSFSCNCFSSAIHPEKTPNPKTPDFFSTSSVLLIPDPSTLGAASLDIHYAVIIVHVEKFLKYPHLIGDEEREELYSMLPEKLRKMVRLKLREPGSYFNGEAKAELWRTLYSLLPLARNTLRWQDEKSSRNWRSYSALGGSNSVLLPQTLFFADREKVENNLVVLLSGITLMWRFAMEMRESSAKP